MSMGADWNWTWPGFSGKTKWWWDIKTCTNGCAHLYWHKEAKFINWIYFWAAPPVVSLVLQLYSSPQPFAQAARRANVSSILIHNPKDTSDKTSPASRIRVGLEVFINKSRLAFLSSFPGWGEDQTAFFKAAVLSGTLSEFFSLYLWLPHHSSLFLRLWIQQQVFLQRCRWRSVGLQ